jgi:hypothetical protein
MTKMETKKENEIVNDSKQIKEKCGIIMPISSIDGCSEQHWTDVKDILTEAIISSGFDANLVSNAADVGIIQKTIIQNIYDNPIVICDVSGKNPNVMFELGMRLAFDKPTIIVIDDKTSYSFDTSPIEHLSYPRDLRFNKIVDFKRDLSEKIIATVKRSKEDKNFSTFLKHFGRFTVAKLDTTEVSKEEFIIEELREMKFTMQRLMQREFYQKQKFIDFDTNDHTRCEDVLLVALKEVLMKMDISSLKDIDSPKMKKMLYSILTNNKMMPSCFDIDNKLCMSKIYEAIDKLTSPNIRIKGTSFL